MKYQLIQFEVVLGWVKTKLITAIIHEDCFVYLRGSNRAFYLNVPTLLGNINCVHDAFEKSDIPHKGKLFTVIYEFDTVEELLRIGEEHPELLI